MSPTTIERKKNAIFFQPLRYRECLTSLFVVFWKLPFKRVVVVCFCIKTHFPFSCVCLFLLWSTAVLVSLFVTSLAFVELPLSLCTDLMIGTQVVVPIHSTAGRSQIWVIYSGELAKLVLVAILRAHLWEIYYHHRRYENEVQGFGNRFQNQKTLYCVGGQHGRNLFPQLCEWQTIFQAFLQRHTVTKSYHNLWL